jgi:hypothetical protein
VSSSRAATVGGDVSQDRQQAKSGLSVTTLMIASASSLAAALVVSRLWGGGTLIGAAMTPVIVALVSEGLHRPARAVPRAVETVRQTRAGRFDPVAEGRAGLREGDLERARNPMPAAAVAERRVHRASGRDREGFSLRMPKPRVMAAVATGLVAFLIAGVFLTSSELVLGKSVTSSSKRTTLVPVHRSTPTTKTTTDKTDTTSKTTTTPTVDTTTTPPAQSTPPPSETTPTAPPAQTAPAAPQATTTAPPAAPAPAPQTTAPAAPPTTIP